jgi:Family of unknown function (DUF6152)
MSRPSNDPPRKIILLDRKSSQVIQRCQFGSRVGGATMKLTPSSVCRLALVLLSGAAPILAHHGFVVEFDDKKPVTLVGVVTKMEFMNPHIYLYVDVKAKDGKVVNWALEGGPPNVLYRQGWRKDTVKPGDQVTVKGFRARDGSNLASCSTITFQDGRVITAGPGPVSQSYGSGNNKK